MEPINQTYIQSTKHTNTKHAEKSTKQPKPIQLKAKLKIFIDVFPRTL